MNEVPIDSNLKTIEQINKFRETARELEADDSVENFERNLKKIVTDKTSKTDKAKSE